MAHPGNLEKPLLWSLFAAYFFMISAFCSMQETLFRLESLPRRACLRNGRDWLDLTEHDGPGFLGHSGRSIHEPPSNLTTPWRC